MELFHGNGNVILLVNVLDVEDYLRGVLPYEMQAKDRSILEALKAQAVAARTYAMTHQGQYSKQYDMYADVRDQMYKGIVSETFISDKAVATTHGILLTFKDKLVKCYYHSTCGGHTANINKVWGTKPVPYLSGLPDTDLNGKVFCRASGYSSWYESWEVGRLADIVKRHIKSATKKAAGKFSKLTGLEVVKRTSSGRVETLKIETDREPILVKGDRIRWALRRDTPEEPILRSSWFEIEKFGPKVLIRGKGMGHGIGMCQMGAMGRARIGQNFIDILYAYYQGTQLVQMK
jgi:stage II sporulation protein D